VIFIAASLEIFQAERLSGREGLPAPLFEAVKLIKSEKVRDFFGVRVVQSPVSAVSFPSQTLDKNFDDPDCKDEVYEKNISDRFYYIACGRIYRPSPVYLKSPE
jgi:hypothetical protein